MSAKRRDKRQLLTMLGILKAAGLTTYEAAEVVGVGKSRAQQLYALLPLKPEPRRDKIRALFVGYGRETLSGHGYPLNSIATGIETP